MKKLVCAVISCFTGLAFGQVSNSIPGSISATVIKSTIGPAATGGILWTLESKSGAPIYVTNNVANTGIRYENPLVINGSGDYTVALVDKQKVVDSIHMAFSFTKATGKRISVASPPSEKYPGNGGAFGLVNGVRSDKGKQSEEWLGWNNKNLEAFIDLGKTQTVSKAAVSVLTDEDSAVFLPTAVQVYTSVDGNTWDQGTARNQTDSSYLKNGKITVSLNKPIEARYLRIVAVNNSGPNSWILADEIEIE